MARPATPIWDSTDLDGPRIDVGARIGWLRRISREGRGVNLADMSRRLAGGEAALSVASISSLERSGQRNGRLIDAYETALELPTGQLRAPVDMICRSLAYGLSDRAPLLAGPTGLARLDALLERVHLGRAAGGDWLTLARGLSIDQVWVVPSRHMRPLVDRLLQEAVRAVGTAYVTRYEALAVLRRGSYGDLVEESVRHLVSQDGAESVAATALCAAAEKPDVGLLTWAAGLLSSPALPMLRGAALALENMRALGGVSERDWSAVVPHFWAAYDGAAAHPERGEVLTMLYKNLPPTVRREIQQGLPGPLAPVYVPASWAADSRNVHYAICERIAHDVTSALGLGEQPLVARMLFEVLYDFRAVRVHAAAFLLMASPLVDALQVRLAAVAGESVDETTRTGALRGLRHLQVPRGREQLQAWFDGCRPYGSAAALLVAGNAGLRLDDALLEQAVDDSSLSLTTVEALGLVQHPGLELLAEDPARSAAVRAAAAWWRCAGGRVTD